MCLCADGGETVYVCVCLCADGYVQEMDLVERFCPEEQEIPSTTSSSVPPTGKSQSLASSLFLLLVQQDLVLYYLSCK